MIPLEQSPSGKLIPFKRSFMTGVLEGTKLLVLRGFSLGLVLFVALGTLRLFNQSFNYLWDVVSRSNKQSKVSRETNPPAFREKISPAQVSVYEVRRPPVREQRSPDRRLQALRESRYFLSELDAALRSFSRFAR